VNATIIILPAALGSVVGMVDGVDDTLKQVINGTKGFSAGAAELDKTLVAMGMGKNSSGGGGIQGQAELVELQKAVTEMGKSTDFDDLKKKIASVSTKGTTNTKAVTDKVAELDGKLNDPNMRPSKKAADEMADLDTRLADLPTQLADAVKGIEQWENAGVCVSTSATNGMSCSDNAKCGMGGKCKKVTGGFEPVRPLPRWAMKQSKYSCGYCGTQCISGSKRGPFSASYGDDNYMTYGGNDCADHWQWKLHDCRLHKLTAEDERGSEVEVAMDLVYEVTGSESEEITDPDPNDKGAITPE